MQCCALTLEKFRKSHTVRLRQTKHKSISDEHSALMYKKTSHQSTLCTCITEQQREAVYLCVSIGINRI